MEKGAIKVCPLKKGRVIRREGAYLRGGGLKRGFTVVGSARKHKHENITGGNFLFSCRRPCP